jgi:ferric-dicitrate binding protein FerR (iron transport regulator)
LKLSEIQLLIDKYLSGTATPKERNAVEQWYESVDGAEGSFTENRLHDLKNDMRDAIFSQLPVQPITRSLFSYVKWVAAVLIAGLGVGLYYYKTTPPAQTDTAKIIPNDIAPGGNKATLTLSDGTIVALDDVAHGKVASQGNAVVRKSEDGLITYNAGKPAAGNTVAYNTIATPRGGKYSVVLSDGTRVWLNAATSIKYPAVFSGSERKVELSGEAYFEVAKNAALPFRVVSNSQVIEVLGTHFNINAYSEEGLTSSTLLEGSIKVSSAAQNVTLKPGQQAVTARTSSAEQAIQINDHVNIEEVIAWKNDMFQFEYADIKTVMNQIGRWYDVDIVYEGKIPSDHYKGKVSRDANVSQVLNILKASGINFKIEGKKIIVK